MLLLQTNNISFQYAVAAEPVFEHISCAIYHGEKIGIIGKNGCGKTTLIKVLCGMLQPSTGLVQKSRTLVVSYLAQENIPEHSATAFAFLLTAKPDLRAVFDKLNNASTDAEKAICYSEYAELDGFQFEAEIEQIRDQFGFDAKFYDKDPSLFSGGEKVKLALLRILLCSPDIVVLDEPTNHLDAATMVWLEEFIRTINVAVIMVSHDRAFLDNTATTLWQMDERGITPFSGSYSAWREHIGQEQQKAKKLHEQTAKQIKKLKKAAAEKREHAERNEHFKPGRSVKKNGGLCKIDDGQRRLVREQSIMKGATVIEARMEKEQDKLAAINLNKERRLKLSLDDAHIKNRFMVVAEHLSKSFDDHIVLDDFSLTAATGEKIALMGNNGSGKSTLLKIIAGKTAPDSGTVKIAPQARVSYFAQEYEELDGEAAIIDYLCRGSKELETIVRITLGGMSIKGDAVFRQIKTLSAGQKSKVALTAMLTRNYDLLLLDEPMSHLELSAREALEAALINYNGTVICVTHDRVFAQKFAQRTIDLSTL